MKVAVIGNGNVGRAIFRELQNLSEIDEITLVGRDINKVKAEVDDYKDSIILRPHVTPRMSSGGYDKTKDADIIICAAGVPQKPGQSRLELVEKNTEVVNSIFTEVNKYNTDSIIIVISNPVDIITHEVMKVTGRPRQKVFGTGTLLDTARCVKFISELLNISPSSINMFVIGEHGDSSVTVLSSLTLLGMSLEEYLSNEIGEEISIEREKLSEKVRSTAGKLIKIKGYTAYGVASAAVRLVYEIIHDTNVILPISCVLDGEYGVKDLAVSVPCVIGRNGINRIQQIKLNEEEKRAFERSVDVIKGIGV